MIHRQYDISSDFSKGFIKYKSKGITWSQGEKPNFLENNQLIQMDNTITCE